MSEVINHKCPCCGGTLEFDIGSQNVKCPYCDAEFTSESLMSNEGDLTVDASDLELSSDAGVEWSSEELGGMAEYVCDSCGGEIYSDSTTSATMCPYCGNAVILKGRLSGTLKPDMLIPFKRTKEQALDAMKAHCSSKRFVPKDFIASNKLEEVKGLYVPFWIYDAEVDADVEYSGVKVRRWSDSHNDYTEYRYYKVLRSGGIAFDDVPVDGSSKMPDDLMESIEPFDVSEVKDFSTGYLSGYVADKYDVSKDDAAPRARTRIKQGAEDAFKRTVTGYDTVSVVSSGITTKKSNSDYVLFPVWLMNSSWNGQSFRFAMNGQTGKLVGNLPLDKKKLSACAIGAFLGIILLIGLGSSVMIGSLELGPFIFGTVFGGVIAVILYTTVKNGMRSVDFKHGAADYERKGSMNITSHSDVFLYKRVETHRRNN